MVQLGPSSARDVGPSRRNKLCSRGRISPEIITSLYIVPRNFTRILLEILSFPAAAAAAARPRKRYTYMYTFLDRFTRSFHPPLPSPPSLSLQDLSFLGFSGCRDTQHHAADDKREGGLYVCPAERHRRDTVRRLRESNPRKQVRTNVTNGIRVVRVCTNL